MKTKQKRGEKAVTQVLDATLVSFAKSGIQALTIQELSARSGVSVGSLYHHFGSREGVLFALYTRCLEAMLVSITAGVVKHKAARAGIEALVHGYLAWVESHPREARFIYAAAHTELVEEFRPELSALAARVVAPLGTWLAPFVQRGEVIALPPALLEVVLIGPAAEASRRLLSGAPGLSFAAAKRSLPGVVWRAVAA